MLCGGCSLCWNSRPRNHFNVLLTTFSTFFIAASAFSIYMEFDQAYLEADFRVWLAIISCKLFLKLVLTWSLTLTKSNSSGTTHASSLKSAISFVDWFGLIWFFIGHLLLLMNLDGLHTFPFLFACVCAYLAYMYAYYTCTLALYLHLGSYPPVSQEDRDLLDTLGVAICLDGNHTSSSNPRVTRRQEGKRKSLAHSTAPLYREKWQAWLAQRGCTERRGDSGEDIEMGGGGGEGDTALCAICLHPLAVAMPTRTSPLSPAPRTASSLPHEFHAACLHTWLHTQHAQQQQRQRLRTSTSTSSGGVEGEEGLLTCPVCRQPPRCRSRGVGNKGTSAGALVDAGAADGGDVV
eukprot:gene25216-30458_t